MTNANPAPGDSVVVTACGAWAQKHPKWLPALADGGVPECPAYLCKDALQRSRPRVRNDRFHCGSGPKGRRWLRVQCPGGSPAEQEEGVSLARCRQTVVLDCRLLTRWARPAVVKSTPGRLSQFLLPRRRSNDDEPFKRRDALGKRRGSFRLGRLRGDRRSARIHSRRQSGSPPTAADVESPPPP